MNLIAMLCEAGHKRPVSVAVDKLGRAVSISEIQNEKLEGEPAPRYYIFPGLADVHVHLREPGFSYKETICSGTHAAAHGGFTDVCAMPNLSPVPDNADAILKQLDIIGRDALINVHPYAAITVGERGEMLSDMDALSKYAVAFSDDGKGVQNEKMMRIAMQKAKSLGKIIAAHCEDESLLSGGYINAGRYASANGHKGISSESEWGPIKRDLALAKETGCAYHVCHISTRESVELIRAAKADGVNVTCETAPHYLAFCEDDLIDDGRFKMNPPLRAREDKEALLAGIADGTIDMIATDHAPHSREEKSRGLKGSAMGIVGLETAFPAMYTALVKTGRISLERLIELMSINPRKRFSLAKNATVKTDFTMFDLGEKRIVDPERFLTQGRATPFAGMELFGVCKLTVCGGKLVYIDEDCEK